MESILQINVSQLLKSPVGSTRNYAVSDAVDVIDDGNCRQVEGKVTMTRTNRGVLVKSTLRTEVEATCSRCLCSFSCPLTLNIEEEYFPTTDVVSGTPLTLPDEPGCFTIDGRHVLDLTEAVYQYALMSIPMKPLCDEDCAGICLGCGHNLNLETCECPPSEPDPRWAKLRQLVFNQ